MKRKIFSWIFKKEINKIHEKYEFEKKKMLSEILELQADLDNKQENYLIAKRVFSLFRDSEIIGVKASKKEEVYIVKNIYPHSLTIYLVSESYQAINGLPRIMGSIKTDYVSKAKYIKINDIQMVDNNIKNGSIAMEFFLKTAEKVEAEYIYGELSSVDSDHFDRLEHYYEKFGFEVTFDEGRTSGEIKKILKK